MTDELKPVRCGCGGQAVIYVTHWWGKCYVCECNECGTASRPCTTEAEAITAWNKAMGADQFREVTEKIESERKKGTWKNVAFLTRECSECGAQYHELEYDNFCPHCGAEMRGRSEA